MNELRRNQKAILMVVRLSNSASFLLIINLVCLLSVFGLVAVGVTALDTYAGFFTKDIASIAELIPIAGALSQLGILLWCVSFSVTGFSALLATQKVEQRFLFYLSLLSFILLLDDAFQIHEKIIPKLFGLSELILFSAEGALLVYIVAKFSNIVIRSRFLWLLAALVWFALSIAVDSFLSENVFPQWHHLLEDGPKFIGIVNWCTYCVLVSYNFAAAAVVGNFNTGELGDR